MRGKIFILFIFNFLLITYSYSQSGWTPQPSGSQSKLFGTSFANSNYGLAVGETGKIFGTLDGGRSWFTQNSDLRYWLNDVSYPAQYIAYTVGFQAGDEFGKIMKTTNDGMNWFSQWSGVNHPLTGVSFKDANTGTAVGWFGIILRTTNGGEFWYRQYATQTHLFDVDFINPNTGIAVGASGTMIKTTNGGAIWYNLWSGVSNDLNAVSMYDENNVFTVGTAGTILRSYDGGFNWVQQYPFMINDLNDICMMSPNHASIVGTDGLILRTSNGGINWNSQLSNVQNTTLFSIEYTSLYHGVVVGGNGNILHTTTGGGDNGSINITPIGNSIPENFSLEQNYPNPFNPNTTIKFSIPKSTMVKLEVFDMTGKQISLLVNEIIPAGNFSYDFNASGISSGIYFYRLRSAEFIETKKMIVTK